MKNGDGMSAEQALRFFEAHGSEISRRFEYLRRNSPFGPKDPNTILSVFQNVEITTPHTPLRLRVNTALDTLPWSSILGTTKFEGFCKWSQTLYIQPSQSANSANCKFA